MRILLSNATYTQALCQSLSYSPHDLLKSIQALASIPKEAEAQNLPMLKVPEQLKALFVGFCVATQHLSSQLILSDKLELEDTLVAPTLVVHLTPYEAMTFEGILTDTCPDDPSLLVMPAGSLSLQCFAEPEDVLPFLCECLFAQQDNPDLASGFE